MSTHQTDTNKRTNNTETTLPPRKKTKKEEENEAAYRKVWPGLKKEYPGYEFDYKPGMSSPAWDYMSVCTKIGDPTLMEKKLRDLEPKQIACCNICGKFYKIKSTGTSTTTSGLMAHLESQRHDLKIREASKRVVAPTKKEQESLKQLHAAGIVRYGAKPKTKADKKAYHTRKVAKWVASYNQAFSVVGNKEFKEMIHSYDPNGYIPTKHVVTQDLAKLNDQMKEKHIEEIGRADVSTTIDHWTPVNSDISYCAFTGSYIGPKTVKIKNQKNVMFPIIKQVWAKQTCLLAITVHSGTQKGTDVVKKFAEDASEYFRSHKNIVACTTDTTGNMNIFLDNLSEKGTHGVYCTDHVLALSCKFLYDDTAFKDGGLDDLRSAAAAVKQARLLVKFFNKSNKAMQALRKQQALLKKNLPDDPDYSNEEFLDI